MKNKIYKKPNGQILAAVAAVKKFKTIKSGIGETAKFYRDNEGNQYLVYEDENNQVVQIERLED